jgi:hypothetical protein
MGDNKTGVAAFPLATEGGHFSEGMTLRDYFAAKAMLGLYQMAAVRAYTPDENDAEQELADQAYLMADAMLKARNK